MENSEHYSGKEYPINCDSAREDAFEEVASLSDEEIPGTNQIETVEEELIERNLTNELANGF